MRAPRTANDSLREENLEGDAMRSQVLHEGPADRSVLLMVRVVHIWQEMLHWPHRLGCGRTACHAALHDLVDHGERCLYLSVLPLAGDISGEPDRRSSRFQVTVGQARYRTQGRHYI